MTARFVKRKKRAPPCSRSSRRFAIGSRRILRARFAAASSRPRRCWKAGTPMREGYGGILCVGDPHLATRPTGFRKDEYAKAILAKLKFCVNHAREHRLLLVLLGDLFHHPRDVSNWMLVELISLFGDEPAYTVAGNHDCRENALTDDDTLSVLAAAGAV